MRLPIYALLLLVCLFGMSASLSAQKPPKDPKEPKEKPDKGGKNGKTDKTDKPDKDGKNGKDDGKDDGKSKNGKTAKADPKTDAKLASLRDLSREEKNTMTRCPLHNQHMSLSDNYRANASDFRESEGYPFARQLNYRRSCKKCTKALIKEEKAALALERKNDKKGTFERCAAHNQRLYINGDFSSINVEKNPDASMPHARQYLGKKYCKQCTAIYKDAEKAKKKEESAANKK